MNAPLTPAAMLEMIQDCEAQAKQTAGAGVKPTKM